MNGRDILIVTIANGIGFMSGIMLCRIHRFLTNSLGFNTKENLHDVSRALVLSPSSSTADPEEALFDMKIAISFNDTGYTTKAEQFFNNICYLLNQDPNFKFDFCLEKQLFHVSDVFGAPSHAPVHSGVVLTNPYLQLNIHIDLAPHSFNPLDQKFNVINFKVTKGLVQGQFRGYTYGSLTKIIEMVKLSMNELGNNYSVQENNCIRFKDILVKQLLKEVSSIIAVGNPGVGKSTILNSLAEELLFKSGISFGGGLTYQMDERFDKNERRFFDTPGLADRYLREPAGQAITQALKKGGEYKLIPVNDLKTIDGILFKNYVNKYLKGAKLIQGKANNIAIHDFEKQTEEIETLKHELKQNKKMVEKKQKEMEQEWIRKEQQAQQALEKKVEENQRMFEKKQMEMKQEWISEKQQAEQALEKKLRENERMFEMKQKEMEQEQARERANLQAQFAQQQAQEREIVMFLQSLWRTWQTNRCLSRKMKKDSCEMPI